MRPTVATPAALQAGEPRHGDAGANHRERRRRMRPDTLHRIKSSDQGHRPDRQRDERRLGKMLDQAQHVAEEALFRDVDAEQLRHLIEHDHQADAGLEAGQDRRRNQVRDEPEAKRRSQRSSRTPVSAVSVAVAMISRPGSPSGTAMPELRCGEDRQSRRRADAQNPRRAQQGIDDHRNEGRVEPDADRQAGDRRIGHGLRQDDGRGRRPATRSRRSPPARRLTRPVLRPPMTSLTFRFAVLQQTSIAEHACRLPDKGSPQLATADFPGTGDSVSPRSLR